MRSPWRRGSIVDMRCHDYKAGDYRRTIRKRFLSVLCRSEWSQGGPGQRSAQNRHGLRADILLGSSHVFYFLKAANIPISQFVSCLLV
jgi:hypothetical protein